MARNTTFWTAACTGNGWDKDSAARLRSLDFGDSSVRSCHYRQMAEELRELETVKTEQAERTSGDESRRRKKTNNAAEVAASRGHHNCQRQKKPPRLKSRDGV